MDVCGDAVMKLKKIDIREIQGFRLGNAEDTSAGTGVTAIIADEGAVAGVDVRGGGPATRETDLLRSENTVSRINAVVLSGGSAFGLESCSGVMRALADRGAGFRVGDISIPIVAGASLFDLQVGKNNVFPDVEMGIKAVDNAYEDVFETGNHGAGTGASVGKILGMERAMKTGLGSFACGDGLIEVGAIAAVNACADVYSGAGNIISGLLSPDRTEIMGTVKVLKGMIHPDSEPDLGLSDIRHLAAEEAKKKATEEKSSGNEKEDIAKALMASYLQEQKDSETVPEESAPPALEAKEVSGTEEPVITEDVITQPEETSADIISADTADEVPNDEPASDSFPAIINETVTDTVADAEVPEDTEAIHVPEPEPEPEQEPKIEKVCEETVSVPVVEPVSYIDETTAVQQSEDIAEVTENEPDHNVEQPSEADEFELSEEDKADFGYDITFNTTISCVITNAIITKSQANKLASILHDAYARAIKPVHMTLDGDTVFVMSTCTQEVNFDAFAALATDVLQYAIIDAAHTAESAYGLPASRDIIRK